MAKADGMYGMFFGILEENSEKKGKILEKQKARIVQLMKTGVDNLKKRKYKEAKDTFAELKAYLKSIQDAVHKNKFNFTQDIMFFTLLGYCYSFLMNTSRDKKEEEVVHNDIASLSKKAPKMQIVKYLELVFAYKKELWGECLYLCEKLRNQKIDVEEEAKNRCPDVMNKHAIPELDTEYCNNTIKNMEEASLCGHMEKLAKLEKAKAGQKPDFTGLDWTKLWSKDLNERIMKRLRSFKKPMNDLDLHKVFHGTVLPMLYGSCCPTSQALYFYFKQEYLFKCEECLRARVQSDTKYEVMKKMEEENISHHGTLCNSDCGGNNDFDDEDYMLTDDDDDEYDSDYDYEVDVPNKKLMKMGENTAEIEIKTNDKTKVDVGTSIDTNKNQNSIEASSKTESSNKKHSDKKTKTRKDKEIQTDKIKANNRYCQTEVPKFKHFGVQVELIKKPKIETKPDLPKGKSFGVQVDLVQPETELVKYHKMTEKVLNDALKNDVNIKNTILNELKEFKALVKEQGLKKDEIKLKGATGLNDVIQTLERIESNQNDVIEKIKIDREDKICKNNFLQKILLDQVNEKYSIYKEIYTGLEKKCKYFIESLAELHKHLTNSTLPTLKDNKIYLNRWQKTLSEIQCQSRELKVIYKKSKYHMINLHQYDGEEWPQIAEIPVEALAFIFDSLKQNAISKKPTGVEMEKRFVNDLYESPKKTKDKSVRIVTPTEEIRQNGRSYSPDSSVHSDGTAESQHESASSNTPLGAAMPDCKPPLSPFTNTNIYPHFEPIPMPPSKFSIDGSGSQHETASINTPLSPIKQKSCVPIPMPAPKFAVVSSNSIEPQYIQSSSPLTPPLPHAPPSMLPPEFYRNFPPPPLPPRNIFKAPLKSSDKANLDYTTTSQSMYKSREEKVFQNANQRNVFSPHFNQWNQNKEEALTYDNEEILETVPVQDNSAARETSETGSSSSLENYMENQRMNKVKLRNVDEHGKEIQEKKEHSDQEIFAFLQKHCSDIPEENLISAILNVMQKLKGSFGNLPKQEILRQVRATLPSRVPWKHTNLPLPEWKSDSVETHCSICFECLSDGSTYSLPCKHEFHKDCIKEWLQANSVCPICRVHSIFDEDFPPLM